MRRSNSTSKTCWMANSRALMASGAEVLAWDDTPGSRDKAAAENIPIVDLAKAGSAVVVISQDLTVFNITEAAVVARQASIDPFRWPVVGQSNTSGPPMSKPLGPPAWWADALISD